MDFKAGLYDSGGDGITGSTDLKIKIKRDADGWFFDFYGGTFKASAHGSLTGTFTEVNATIVPGEYEYYSNISTWDDGLYTVYINYTISPKWVDSVEFRVKDGQEVTTAYLISETIVGIANTIMGTVVDGAINVQELFSLLAAVKIGNIGKAGDVYTFSTQSGATRLTATKTASDVTRVWSSSLSSSSFSSSSFSSSSSSFSSSSFSSSSSSFSSSSSSA